MLNDVLHEAADENEAKMATNNSSVSPLAKALVGWVLESPGRGTLSLISACVFTIITDTPLPITAVYLDAKATKDPAGPKLEVSPQAWTGALTATAVTIKQ